jgi:hypothetical protein
MDGEKIAQKVPAKLAEFGGVWRSLAEFGELKMKENAH